MTVALPHSVCERVVYAVSCLLLSLRLRLRVDGTEHIGGGALRLVMDVRVPHSRAGLRVARRMPSVNRYALRFFGFLFRIRS